MYFVLINIIKNSIAFIVTYLVKYKEKRDFNIGTQNVNIHSYFPNILITVSHSVRWSLVAE